MNKKNITNLKVTQYAQEVLNKIKILENPYFQNLKNEQMSFEQFLRTQEQFYFAVDFFSRPMMTIVSRIPKQKDRLDILKNVVEEHGNFKEADFHINTFKQFLKALGSEIKNFENIKAASEVKAFNNALLTTCNFEKLEIAIACMGVIEMAFSKISSLIANSVIQRGWLSKETMYHYKLHSKLDVQHAEEFFLILEKSWIEKQPLIKEGIEFGAYIFNQLYLSLNFYNYTPSLQVKNY